MSENKKLLPDDEIAKVTGGLVMQFPDGWYVCSDDRERRQIYGPYKDEDRACEIAARNGYSYEMIYGPVTAPAKEG